MLMSCATLFVKLDDANHRRSQRKTQEFPRTSSEDFGYDVRLSGFTVEVSSVIFY